MPYSARDHDARRVDASMPLLRRLVYGLALLPIVPGMAALGAECCATWFGTSRFDDLRWFNLFVALLWVGCSVVIWRAVVIWTLGRSALT
ncbi:MAG: hypothetical protein ACYS7M_04085, partial [Planctomycetota bacterium]